MSKLAQEVHQQGLKHRDRTTKAVCIKSIALIKSKGKPVKQYEPFFSSTHLFEGEPEMTQGENGARGGSRNHQNPLITLALATYHLK